MMKDDKKEEEENCPLSNIPTWTFKTSEAVHH